VNGTEVPIISSHTGLREICDLQRNINLEQASRIFERGGMVGIAFNPDMLSPEGSANMETVFAHLDTLVQRFGPEGVCIGSDFCGYEGTTEGLEDITGIFGLREVMRTHGYDEGTVSRIMGLNWLRLFESLFNAP
jgi:membrane dipeptidase